MAPRKPLLELTAEEVMVRDITTIPEGMSLRDAAHVLRRAGVGGAPVVDPAGRCVGVISAFDFLRWAEGEVEAEPVKGGRACPYRVKGHPASGYAGWICVLAEGGCPFQETQPTTAGRHVSVCLRAPAHATDWPWLADRLPTDSVRGFMTKDVVTADRRMRLPELARRMVDAGVHRLIVTDETGKPLGLVSSESLMAALDSERARADAVACEAG